MNPGGWHGRRAGLPLHHCGSMSIPIPILFLYFSWATVQCPVRRRKMMVCSRLSCFFISHCCELATRCRIGSLRVTYNSLHMVVKVRGCGIDFLFSLGHLLSCTYLFIPTCAGIHCSTTLLCCDKDWRLSYISLVQTELIKSCHIYCAETIKLPIR